jgi:hypothetical protein
VCHGGGCHGMPCSTACICAGRVTPTPSLMRTSRTSGPLDGAPRRLNARAPRRYEARPGSSGPQRVSFVTDDSVQFLRFCSFVAPHSLLLVLARTWCA